MVSDVLTIDHLGYEGDQSHKHARDEPMPPGGDTRRYGQTWVTFYAIAGRGSRDD